MATNVEQRVESSAVCGADPAVCGAEPDTGDPAVCGAEPDTGDPAVCGAEPDTGDPAVCGAEPDTGDPDEAAGTAVPRKPVPGVIYLGYIPPGLQLSLLRKMLSAFGELGRIFLQPADEKGARRKRKTGILGKNFTEGWVEYQNKAVAKRVARSLHNTPIGTRKRSRFHDDLWNMKYLHRFKWIHLSERLAYEKLVKRQRMRVEVSQAKRETNFFLQNVEKSRGLEKLQEMKRKKGEEWQEKSWHFNQRATEAEIQASKDTARTRAPSKAKELGRVAEFHRKSQTNTTLLARIFNPAKEQE